MDVTEIKNLRLVLKLSRAKFAQILGVTRMTVTRWEKREAKPSPLAQEKLERLRKRYEKGRG